MLFSNLETLKETRPRAARSNALGFGSADFFFFFFFAFRISRKQALFFLTCRFSLSYTSIHQSSPRPPPLRALFFALNLSFMRLRPASSLLFNSLTRSACPSPVSFGTVLAPISRNNS